jgi:hypothetical protein
MTVARLPVLLSCLVALLSPATAGASELIDRDATGVRLAVDRSGKALLTYQAAGKLRRVLAWDAVNAIEPTTARRQLEFRLDYAGGWGAFKRDVWQDFENACAPYDGPALGWLVLGCKAPDGSYWAVQSWQRMLPNYGVAPAAQQGAWELRLSHWTGALPMLEVKLDWSYRRYDHLYGRFTYAGRPVHGFRTTTSGEPLDTFGRNLYVDTMDSAYGAGWRRENSFVTHRGTGSFCYGFYAHGARPAGTGRRYRATIIGPGVTPDVVWHSRARGPYDSTSDAIANAEQRELFANSTLCRPN